MTARAIAQVLCLLLALLPARLAAQGFAGLGGEADGFTPVTRPADLSFPRDHGPHPDFRIEWWYLTANLTGPDGEDLGIQWTLFRQALVAGGRDAPGWQNGQIWMAHAAATSAGVHHVAEKLARGGVGQAEVTAAPFRAFIDDWSLVSTDARGDALAGLRVHAAGEGFSYDLTLSADLPPVLQGINGYSAKSDSGQASYYYSQPFYRVSGTLTLDGRVMPVTGQGWLDREWSSQPLKAEQTGWDWFALHLDSGEKLMAYRLRTRDGRAYVFGTWIAADGRPTPLAATDLVIEPGETAEVAGRRLPVSWRLSIARFGLLVDLTAVNPHSFMATAVPYWEGPIRIWGSRGGRGYLEMTGY